MYTTPYTQPVTRHPLFRRDVRRIRWAWSEHRLRRTNRHMLIRVHVVVAVIWVLLMLVFNRQRLAIYETVEGILFLSFFVTIGADALVDLVAMQAGLNSFSGEVAAGRWDLLQLTPLREDGIVAAKHAIAQLRAWRMMLAVVGTRIAVLVLGPVFLEVVPFLVSGYDGFIMVSLVDGFTHDPLGTVSTLVVIGIIGLVFVLEPFWRMRAMTALSLAISTQIMDTTLAALAGLGAILAVWLAQAVIIISLTAGLGVFSSVILLFPTTTALFFMLYLLFLCLVMGWTIFGFYNILESWSLRRAARRILKTN